MKMMTHLISLEVKYVGLTCLNSLILNCVLVCVCLKGLLYLLGYFTSQYKFDHSF